MSGHLLGFFPIGERLRSPRKFMNTRCAIALPSLDTCLVKFCVGVDCWASELVFGIY